MLLQDLLVQIAGLLENINNQMESVGEVVKNITPDDPQLGQEDHWQTDGWSEKKGGWKSGNGWSGPGGVVNWGG